VDGRKIPGFSCSLLSRAQRRTLRAHRRSRAADAFINLEKQYERTSVPHEGTTYPLVSNP
jgi:hypothetical protein